MKVTKRQAIASGVIAVVAAGGISALALMGGGATTTPPKASTPARSVLTGKPGAAGRVLAVKIDNVQQARPAVGTTADIVYALQVEGGLSRLMAVYDTHAGIPKVVGPVRSARETDLSILGAYNHPALAYSGAVTPLQHVLDHDPAIANNHDGHTFRMPGRSAPHNEFLHARAAVAGAGTAKDIGLKFGAAPQGGSRLLELRTDMPAASFTFDWNGRNYAVTMDGTRSPWIADTVILQHVHVGPSPHGYKDCNGGGGGCVTEPFTQTVGHGTAVVLRDGRSYNVTWSRANDHAPTHYVYQGKDMPLHPGRTWVVLN